MNATTSAGALYGYGEEGKQEIEDKMAGLTVGGAKGEVAKDVEGEPDLNAEENEKDEDLEKLEKQFERLRLKAEHDGHHRHEIPAPDHCRRRESAASTASPNVRHR